MCLEGAITREQRERLKQTEREDLEKAFSKKLSLVDDGKSGGGRKASSSYSSSSKKNADAATMESSDLREVIEKKRAGASAEKGVGKSGEKVNKEQQHAQSPSTKNSRQRRAEMRKEKREGAQETKKKSSDKSTSVAQAATAASESGKKKKKENDVGGEALEVLKKSQEEAAKMEKKKKEEEEKNTADEEGPPGYPQPKYSDYLAKKETEKEEDTKKKEYTLPFAHILQCRQRRYRRPLIRLKVPEGKVLFSAIAIRCRPLFNVDSTWQGSAAFAPPTKLTRESIKSIPSFTPGTPVKTNNNNNNNKPRERIPREEKDDHLTANDLYKTELCRSWIETGECRYNDKCQFAHGHTDSYATRRRHPKYKTQVCRTYTTTGQCPYGNRCRFIHEKLPEKGVLGTLATNGHYVITEDWKPGEAKILCVCVKTSRESLATSPSPRTVKTRITRRKGWAFSDTSRTMNRYRYRKANLRQPSSPTSAEEGEIRGARTYQEQDQQHQRANQNLEFEGFAGPIPRTPDLSKRYF